MLVGKANVTVADVERHSKTVEEFLEYSDSLVPNEFKHVTAIKNNQRYLCCLLLRNSKNIDWKKKNEMLSILMREISIVGYTDSIIEVGTIMNLVNKERLTEFGKKR